MSVVVGWTKRCLHMTNTREVRVHPREMYPPPHMTCILLLRTVPQYLRHQRVHPHEMYPPPHMTCILLLRTNLERSSWPWTSDWKVWQVQPPCRGGRAAPSNNAVSGGLRSTRGRYVMLLQLKAVLVAAQQKNLLLCTATKTEPSWMYCEASLN